MDVLNSLIFNSLNPIAYLEARSLHEFLKFIVSVTIKISSRNTDSSISSILGVNRRVIPDEWSTTSGSTRTRRSCRRYSFEPAKRSSSEPDSWRPSFCTNVEPTKSGLPQRAVHLWLIRYERTEQTDQSEVKWHSDDLNLDFFWVMAKSNF